MTEVVTVDFQAREELSREYFEPEDPVVELRPMLTRENASRDELIEQAANVSAALEDARIDKRHEVSEGLQDLLSRCFTQIDPEYWAEVQRLAAHKLGIQPLDTA